VHLMEAYRELGHKEGDFPQAEKAAREVLSLPMYPELTNDQIRTIAQAVNASMRQEVLA
jgi:dTDP-4-amino-4,6-dideoxygalactose transaminase